MKVHKILLMITLLLLLMLHYDYFQFVINRMIFLHLCSVHMSLFMMYHSICNQLNLSFGFYRYML